MPGVKFQYKDLTRSDLKEMEVEYIFARRKTAKGFIGKIDCKLDALGTEIRWYFFLQLFSSF